MSEPIRAEDILKDPRELWMNTPEGYPFAQRVSKNDVGGLKGFLINTTAGDEELAEMIRQMSHVEVIQSCLDNSFTFDPEWYGARLFDWQKQ